MKKYKLILMVVSLVLLINTKVYAYTGSWDITNYGSPSSKSFQIYSTTSSNTTLNMWHYSGGYWKGTFYSGGTSGSTLQVSDDDINQITDLKFLKQKISISIPQTVKNYASTYGWNNIKVRINSGLSGITTSNTVMYDLDSTNGKLNIYPDLQLRVGGNFWSGKGFPFYLPKPLSFSYGYNAFAIYNRSGTSPTYSGNTLNYSPTTSRYLNSPNEVRMVGSDGYLTDSKTYQLLYPSATATGSHLRIGVGTFKSGGAQGIVWNFPFNITWYLVDPIAPSGTFSPYSSSWTKNNITVSFDPSDTGGSGVNQWMYRTSSNNGASWSGWSSAISGDTTSNIALNSEGNWKIQCWVQDKVDNQSYIQSGTYYIDKTAPTIQSANIENVTAYGFDVVINNVNDNGGSGVNHINTVAYYNGDWQNTGQWKDTYCSDGASLRLRVNTSDFGGKSGTYNFDIRAYDNVGNGGQVLKSFVVYVPYWTNPSTQYGGVWKDTGSGPGESVYTSSDGVKWVKPNQGFYISSVGYSNSTDQQIDEAHLRVYNANNTSEEQIIKSGCARNQVSSNNYWQDSSPINTIKFLGGGGFIRRGDDWSPNANGKYVESYFKMSLTTDNNTYSQGSRMLCIDGGNYYWSNSSNFDYYNTIKTDGTAPGFLDSSNTTIDSKVETFLNLDPVSLDLNVSVNNLYDNGSGIASVYANIYPGTDKSLLKKYNFVNSNGSWTLNLSDLSSIFNSDTVTVDIYTVDNVGNVGLIKTQAFDLLTVRAYIVPYDDPSFDGVPTLMKGQKAIIKIYTTGGANKIKIEFPLALYNLNNALNDVLNITPSSNSYGEYIFNVPLNAADGSYQVTVTAIKDITNSQKSCYPQFVVQNSILDGIKTRRRE